MPQTCRCCLSSQGVEPIFHKIENTNSAGLISYSEMINAIASNKVVSSDGLPDQICSECSMELKQAYKFRLKCDNAYLTLIALHSYSDESSNVKKDESPKKDVELETIFKDGEEPNNEVEEIKDVKTIKVEFEAEDSIQDEGFICYEPLEDFDVEENDEFPSQNDKIKEEEEEGVADDLGNLEESLPLSSFKTRSNIHSCSVCLEKFKFKTNLIKHIKKMHPSTKPIKTKNYFCILCEKSYSNERRHNRKHHESGKTYTCSICQENYKSAQLLGTHMEIHKVNGALKCGDCPAEFTNMTRYYKHIIIHREKKHLCHICSKAFTYKYGLTVHVRTHTQETPYPCPVCKKSFKTGNQRNNHVDKKHPEIDRFDEKMFSGYLDLKLNSKKRTLKKRKNACGECGKVLYRKRDLLDHMNRHLGIKSYCELCDKYVTSQSRHQYFHKIKNVDSTCSICFKTFITKATLKTHMRTHTKERPFQCPQCEKTFTQQGTLNMHLLRHKNEKNFICHFCSKQFISKYKLSIHIRAHTNERPFACNKCPRKFVTGNQLRIHKQRHETSRPLSCDQCDKTFKTKNDLRAHIKVHEKIRKHPCRLCEKVFYRTDHRQRHERTVHCMNTKNEVHVSRNQTLCD